MFNTIFHELIGEKYFTRNNKFQRFKRLRSLQVKAASYLETKRASMMELFCEYT